MYMDMYMCLRVCVHTKSLGFQIEILCLAIELHCIVCVIQPTQLSGLSSSIGRACA